MKETRSDVTLSIDGGSDTNTLDYAGYAGNVLVDLPLGVATGLSGGISHFQNVKGASGGPAGSYNVLVGNGGNVLTGGTGRRNLLIAGAAASQLYGGDDQDIRGPRCWTRPRCMAMAVVILCRVSGAWALILTNGMDTDPKDGASGLDPASLVVRITP